LPVIDETPEPGYAPIHPLVTCDVPRAKLICVPANNAKFRQRPIVTLALVKLAVGLTNDPSSNMIEETARALPSITDFAPKSIAVTVNIWPAKKLEAPRVAEVPMDQKTFEA
jgi:hypothetical protein